MLKKKYQKEKPKILIIYCDFKKFTYTNLQPELISKLKSYNLYEYYTLKKSFLEILDKHAVKNKILPGDQKPYINKTLRSAIMKHS